MIKTSLFNIKYYHKSVFSVLAEWTIVMYIFYTSKELYSMPKVFSKFDTDYGGVIQQRWDINIKLQSAIFPIQGE